MTGYKSFEKKRIAASVVTDDVATENHLFLRKQFANICSTRGKTERRIKAVVSKKKTIPPDKIRLEETDCYVESYIKVFFYRCVESKSFFVINTWKQEYIMKHGLVK